MRIPRFPKWLLALCFIAVGCTALDGNKAELAAPQATATEIVKAVAAPAEPAASAPVAQAASSAPSLQEASSAPKVLTSINWGVLNWPVVQQKSCGSHGTKVKASTAPVAKGASCPPSTTSSEVVVPFTLADPLPIKRASTLGDATIFGGIGYGDGNLVYLSLLGNIKVVEMREQVVDLTMHCSSFLEFDGQHHSFSIMLTAAVSPSLLWESEFHRLVAKYGDRKRKVTSQDIVTGAKNYIAQHQEALCAQAGTRSLSSLYADKSLHAVAALNRWFLLDERAAFEMTVHTVDVILPEGLTATLALRGLGKSK